MFMVELLNLSAQLRIVRSIYEHFVARYEQFVARYESLFAKYLISKTESENLNIKSLSLVMGYYTDRHLQKSAKNYKGYKFVTKQVVIYMNKVRTHSFLSSYIFIFNCTCTLRQKRLKLPSSLGLQQQSSSKPLFSLCLVLTLNIIDND